MQRTTPGNPWNAWVEASAPIRLLDSCLRGASQVMLQDNPVTGLLFLTAIVWAGQAAARIEVAAGAVLGLVVATATASLLRCDPLALRQGMFGFNGLLVGAALPTFLAAVPLMWLCLIMGAAVSTVAMLATTAVMKDWGAPALTFPFVLTSWLLLLAAYSFAGLPIAAMPPAALPQEPSAAATLAVPTPSVLSDGLLAGVSQVFLLDDALAGLLILAGLAVSSLWAALFAFGGAALGLGGAMLLGARLIGVDAGLYGFSPVLTAVALGTVFYRPGWRTVLYAGLATAFTVVVQGALNAALAPLGIPTLTAPFVLVTWLFLLPRADLRPHPHAPISRGVLSTSRTLARGTEEGPGP